MMRPPSDGPPMEAIWENDGFQVMALPKTAGGRICGSSEERAGLLTARAAPVSISRAYIQKMEPWVAERTARPSEQHAITERQTIITRRRSNWSAMWPEGRVSRR